MKITLIDFTGSGHPEPARYAAAIMAFTKSTRLTMSPGLLSEIMNWPMEKLHGELQYMARTIPSSWEFVDYTFLIEGVTRGYTHQQVRTRAASFAQQTMRVLDVSEGPGWTYGTGPTIVADESAKIIYDETMEMIGEAYKALIEIGATIEDARGVLPTNIHTNLVMKINMRNFVDLVRKRSSPRVQGEYRSVLEGMQAAVEEVHPWISIFISRTFERAAKELDAEIAALKELDAERATRMLKLIDEMRAQS